MKLTAEQIEYVSGYIQSFDIKWYELQVELTDHFVSIMEEIWQEDEELTFHQVKYRAEYRFGKYYFKNIEEERTAILRKEYKKQQWSMVREYLKFPKFIMSFLLVILVYRVSFYFEDIILFIKILFGILLVVSVVSIFNWLRQRKINGKRFLSLEIVYVMNNTVIILSYWLMLLAKNFKETLQEKHLCFLSFCCIWVLWVLLIIAGTYLTNKVALDIKKQYQLT